MSLFTTFNAMISANNGILPNRSLLFSSASNMSLSMSLSNYGYSSFNRSKSTYSLWYKRSSIGQMGLYIIGDVGTNKSIQIFFDSANKIQVITSKDGTTNDGRLVTTATFTDTSSWHNIEVIFDYLNATPNDRLILYHDGIRITSFSTQDLPTGALYASIDAAYIGFIPGIGSYYNGLIFQPCSFSGVVISNGALYSNGNPVAVTTYNGLWSLLNTNDVDALTYDYVRPFSWTNNAGVTISVDTP